MFRAAVLVVLAASVVQCAAAGLPRFLLDTLATSAASASKPAAWEIIGRSNTVGVQMVAIPGTNKFLFMERPTSRHPDGQAYNTAWFDLDTRTSTNVVCATSLENAGHSFTADGKVLVLAGHKPQSKYPEGRRGIRMLDMQARKLADLSQLQYGHWLATASQLPSGHIMIISDSPKASTLPALNTTITNPFYELWDPAHPTAPTKLVQLSPKFLKYTKYLYYPFVYTLPTGDAFVWSNTYGQIIQPLTGRVVMELPTFKYNPLAASVMTAYPFAGTSVLLPLMPNKGYAAEVVIFGGAYSYGWINTTAVNKSMRLRIGSRAGYDVGQWEVETMPSPRVMGDSVLLPNGQVVIINGAKAGLQGDAAAGGVAMGNDPNMCPVLYDPSAPAGSRYTQLQCTTIPRMLHSSAGLTPDGSILVAGCDRCDRFWSSAPSSSSYDKCPTGFWEYRLQLFRPPAWFIATNKPSITSAPTTIRYGRQFNVQYTMPASAANAGVVTGAVLVAPSSCTHSYNMHQRVVGMEIATDEHLSGGDGDDDAQTLVVQGPPNANIAPPGMYMLFLISGQAYSKSVWVTLK